MRAVGRRKKKLIVAFHFQFANQAGWECETCRKSGLEKRRRCGWVGEALETPERVVWARKGAASEVCPRSSISGQSMAWLEAFAARKRLGAAEGVAGMAARDVEAFLVLEQEWAAEQAGRWEDS